MEATGLRRRLFLHRMDAEVLARFGNDIGVVSVLLGELVYDFPQFV
jgi:hypothetical protein